MVDVDTIEIDNKTWIIVKEKNNYLYLSNINNPEDVCIKKSIMKDNQEYIAPLKNEEEFKKALDLFKD